MRILLAEDDAALADQVAEALKGNGYRVDHAPDGEEAHFLGSTETYDLVVLDLGLPRRDGLSVLKEWRADDMGAPVLILTARDGWAERVDGLDAGADDYVVKPFNVDELLARVRALLRRQAQRANPVFVKGAFAYDTRSRRATLDGAEVSLTQQEAAVLDCLVHNANRFLSQTEISESIYG